jgi:hypothetical protein
VDGKTSKLGLVFLPDIQQLVDLCDRVAFCIFYHHQKLRLDLGLRVGGSADFGDLLFAR